MGFAAPELILDRDVILHKGAQHAEHFPDYHE